MIWLVLLVLLGSCAIPYYHESAKLMQEGHFDAATLPLAKADLPYQGTNESPLLLLSRAMVYFHSSKYTSSAHDFEKALDAIDYYSQTSTPEIAGQVLIQDSLGAYVPPPFEVSLARFYQALAFLHQNDEDSAAATLYYLENHLAPSEQNPLASYLLATLFQRRGDVSNARILYSRVKTPETAPTVLVIHHRGQAPLKSSQMAPVSMVSAALVEKLLDSQNIRPALSTLTGIPIPHLESGFIPHSSLLMVNNKRHLPSLSYDIRQAASTSLKKEMPLIAARAAARLLIRRGLVASTHKNYQPLMDAAMLISNLTTEADTRSWASLPAHIDLYALDLPPGEHLLRLGKHEKRVTVSSKNLVVVEVFQPKSDNVYISTEEAL